MKTDPYFSDSLCISRLKSKYRKYNKLIVAVDFDDTIFDFYNTGAQYPKLISLLRECNSLEFPIIIYTARAPSEYRAVEDYVDKMGIRIAAINKNLPGLGHSQSKVYYNILLDDKAGLEQAHYILQSTIEEIKNEKLIKKSMDRIDFIYGSCITGFVNENYQI